MGPPPPFPHCARLLRVFEFPRASWSWFTSALQVTLLLGRGKKYKLEEGGGKTPVEAAAAATVWGAAVVGTRSLGATGYPLGISCSPQDTASKH